MAYEVRIIGSNDPIVVDDNAKGMRLMAMYEDDSIPDSQKLSIGDGFSTRKGQIRYVKRVEGGRSEGSAGRKVADDTDTLHMQRHRRLRVLAPEKKTEMTALFRHCFRVVTGREPGKADVDGFRTDAAEFFRTSPNRIVPSPKCFTDHIPEARGGSGYASKFMLRLLERVIVEDILTAKRS